MSDASVFSASHVLFLRVGFGVWLARRCCAISLPTHEAWERKITRLKPNSKVCVRSVCGFSGGSALYAMVDIDQ